MNKSSSFWRTAGARRLFILLFLVHLLLLVGILLVMPIVRFSEKLDFAKDSAAYDSLTAASESNLRDALDSWRELTLENAALRAQLLASTLDSAYLLVNLKDSVISLCIKGVTVRSSKLNRFSGGETLKHIRNSPEAEEWLSRPLIAYEEWSSFVKHPFKIKNAPKDTLEALAMKQDIMTPDPIDAYCAIAFERNVLLRLSQQEPLSKGGVWKRIGYELAFQWSSFQHLIDDLRQFSAPAHRIVIAAALPKADIVAMFRALPHNCSMVLLF